MGSSDVRLRLRGRHSECELLDRLVAGAKAGQSGVLVLRGEAGIGKSALLDYVQDRSTGCRVARLVGVESEMELAYSGLHQLCAPILDGLPSRQSNVLETAFGLSAGEPPGRFSVGMAVLGLLAEAAEAEPLICLIDDAQWLDRASVQTLAFVSRRLLADRVALVFAVREPSEERDLTGIDELKVGGISDSDARALLGSVLTAPVDQRIRDRIVAESRGNPLAVLEVPRGLTPAELAGGFGLPDALPLANRIEEGFRRRLLPLPLETRQLLLVAAAEPVGDVPLLWRAAAQLGIAADASTPAEGAGLIDIGLRVRFRHPLVRSAVYRAAPPQERRTAHRALAEAIDGDLDPDRRAWHRAYAADGPDELVAGELVQSAERVQARGGIAAAAAFLERATELTLDPGQRAERALAAAQAKFKAGALDAAYELLAAAEDGPMNDLERARLARLRAEIVFARRRGSEAAPMLLDAAKRLDELGDGFARETYLEALGAAIFAGRLGRYQGVQDVAAAARLAREGHSPPRPMDLLLDGVATRFTEGYVESVPLLRRALSAFQPGPGDDQENLMRWLWLACPVAPEPIAPELWDDEAWHELSTRALQLARDAGALAVLPVALAYRAGVHVHAGEFTAAAAALLEADAIAAATGNPPLSYASLMLAAWRGDESQTVKLIDEGVKDANSRGEGRALGLSGYVTAVLYNGLGQYEAAMEGARQACEHEDLGFFGWSLTELVEAAARSDAREVAAEALRQLEDQTRAAGTDWALGILARSSALLSEGPAAETLYCDAIERLERGRIAVHLARARLLYGEWLRRENRRREARVQLRAAYESFSHFGAEAFAERARRELLATGETVRKRTVDTTDVLTPQEAQIAHLAGDGFTNPEIGAQLFISRRTVEWHLRKVFMKLDITSRKQIRVALSGAIGEASAG